MSEITSAISSKYERQPIRTVAGMVALLTVLSISRNVGSSLFADEGRGAEITACATNYDGYVKVDDPTILNLLGNTARALGIHDPEASGGFTDDYTSSPGELACEALVDNFSGETITVLLPEGMDALDRSGYYALHPGVNNTASFPDGLSWK